MELSKDLIIEGSVYMADKREVSMCELNERYCVYKPSTNEVYKVCETKQEALSETRFANVFRKMCGKESLMVGKCALTQEELKVLAEMEE